MPDASNNARTLDDLAVEVRSKNAGPFWMTLDVSCRTTAPTASPTCDHARSHRRALPGVPAIAAKSSASRRCGSSRSPSRGRDRRAGCTTGTCTPGSTTCRSRPCRCRPLPGSNDWASGETTIRSDERTFYQERVVASSSGHDQAGRFGSRRGRGGPPPSARRRWLRRGRARWRLRFAVGCLVVLLVAAFQVSAGHPRSRTAGQPPVRSGRACA